VALAGYSCFLFCRELRAERIAAALGGITFMLSGFIVTRAYRGQLDPLMTIAWMPLIFWLAERAERRGELRWYLWTGLIGALQVTAGAPQFAWLTWVGLVIYVLGRRIVSYRDGWWRAVARSVAGLAVALAFTAGIAAVQIVPTLELAGESIRADGSVDFAAGLAYEPQKIVHWLFPNYFLSPGIQYFNNVPEATGYIGLAGLILATVGLLRDRTGGRWPLLAVAVVGVAMMLGRQTPLFDLLFYAIPGFGSFRIPSRAIVLLALS
jgi:hypothetical protein